MGGSNAFQNLVYLTAEEHYVAHQLLVKIHPGVGKLVFAALGMSIDYHGNRHSNKSYSWIRSRAAEQARLVHLGKPKPGVSKSNAQLKKGVPLSAEHRAAISKARKGVALPKLQGRKHSDEHRLKNSLAQRGTKKPGCGGKGVPKPGTSAKLKGVPKSAEHNAKNSEALKLRVRAAAYFEVLYRNITKEQISTYREYENSIRFRRSILGRRART